LTRNGLDFHLTQPILATFRLGRRLQLDGPRDDRERRLAGGPEYGCSRKVPSELLRVLIVDDIDAFRRSFALMLRSVYHVHEVAEAEDGAAAIEKVQADAHFDYIFVDVAMPHIDGFEVCRRLKAMNIDAQLILMSSDDSLETRERASAIKVSFLSKTNGDDALTVLLGRPGEGEPS
jgi:CheY-like chemotaxis protein